MLQIKLRAAPHSKKPYIDLLRDAHLVIIYE
jgi:hypothetical protein